MRHTIKTLPSRDGLFFHGLRRSCRRRVAALLIPMALLCAAGQNAATAAEAPSNSTYEFLPVPPGEWFSQGMKTGTRLTDAPADTLFASANYSHSDCWLKYMSGYAGPFIGINPSTSGIFNVIRSLSIQHKVPIEIIGAVCYIESRLDQYGADGFVVHNLSECISLYYGDEGGPPGLGLMQLTGSTATSAYDVNRLITDWRYNLEAGVDVLRLKYDYAFSLDPAPLQTIAAANWNVLENWRYALAYYNGYQYSENPYVTAVCNVIAAPPSPLSGLFAGTTLTRPQDVIPGFIYGNGYAVTPEGSWLYYDGSTYYGAAHKGTTMAKPTIEANGATGTATVNYPDAVCITVEMNAGDYARTPMDLWIVALAGSSWYYLNSSVQWTPCDSNLSNCHPIYQGGLFNLPATEVLNIPGLPIGSYTFWFAIDPMDGILDPNGQLLFDNVTVTVR